MAGENNLFEIDAIVADGVAIPFESASARLVGAAGFERDAVPSAQGDDFTRRKRVTRQLKANIQFGPSVDPDALMGMDGIQITARDTQSGRRALMTRCSTASVGEIGAGPVEVVWLVLSPIQWL